MVHIDAGVEVGVALVATSGTQKELASAAVDPLSCRQAEPHPFGSTTRAVLRRTMWIDFDTDYTNGIGLFAVQPPRNASSRTFDLA